MELKLVSKDFHQLPGVTAFNCVTDGAIATFTRKHGNEEVSVTLDANSAVEVDSTADDFDTADQDVSYISNWLTTNLLFFCCFFFPQG